MARTFQLTSTHMAAFSRQQRERFEDEVAAFLRRAHPREWKALGETAAVVLVRDGVEKARRYDLVLEEDAAAFIELMLTVSPDFDTSEAWAEPILREPIPGHEKLERIYERLMFAPPAEGH